jgi:hypothetical protein
VESALQLSSFSITRFKKRPKLHPSRAAKAKTNGRKQNHPHWQFRPGRSKRNFADWLSFYRRPYPPPPRIATIGRPAPIIPGLPA